MNFAREHNLPLRVWTDDGDDVLIRPSDVIAVLENADGQGVVYHLADGGVNTTTVEGDVAHVRDALGVEP